MERHKFSIRNQQRHRRAILDHDSRETIIRTNPQEIAIAKAAGSLDELVTDVVSKTKGVENVLPIAATDNESFAVLLLPFEQARFQTPPGIKMHVLNSTDVINGVHKNPSPQRLALNVPD